MRSRRRAAAGRLARAALALACVAATLHPAAAKPLASLAIMKLSQIDPLVRRGLLRRNVARGWALARAALCCRDSLAHPPLRALRRSYGRATRPAGALPRRLPAAATRRPNGAARCVLLGRLPAGSFPAPLALAPPQAVCNDGSVGAFYMHTASDPSMSNVWLIYLEGACRTQRKAFSALICVCGCAPPARPAGGDWCYSAQSCGERFRVSPQFMSSNGWPGEISLGGIMSENPDKSPWAGVNKAYLGYCSSDAWIGDVAASTETFGIAFRGQRIVSATLQFLVSNHGMGSVPGTRILFAGCSAGSRGALFTADYVLPMLVTMGVDPTFVEVQAMFDSPLWVDVLPITGATGPIMPLETQTQAVLALVGATNRLGPTCAMAYPGTESWKCLYGQYRLPFVETPFVLNAAQFDRFQLPYNEGGNPPYTAAGLAYAASFQAAVRTALAPLPTAAQNGSDVFSSACFHHCVTDETTFWGLKVANVSFRDLAGAWFFQRRAPLRIVEDCTGFKCGQCRSHRKDPGAPPDPAKMWKPGRPPHAPAPPDPFAIWSPPPSLRPGQRAPAPLTVRATPSGAGGPGGHHAVVIVLMLLIAAGVAVACFAPRGSKLRVLHGERAMELEVDTLIGGSGRRPPGYGASTETGGDTPMAAFRSDARYAAPKGAVPPPRGPPTAGGKPRAGSKPPEWTRK
jgi:hypothetical protein